MNMKAASTRKMVRIARREEEPTTVRADLEEVYERARDVRRELLTDAAEMEWEDEAIGASRLHTVIRALEGLLEIEAGIRGVLPLLAESRS